MKVAVLVIAALLVATPLALAAPFSLGSGVTATIGETCLSILMHGGDVGPLGFHRYGGLDVKAMKKFCEMIEASNDLMQVTDSGASACAKEQQFLDTSIHAFNGDGITQYAVPEEAGTVIGADATKAANELDFTGADGAGFKINAALARGYDVYNHNIQGDLDNFAVDSFPAGSLSEAVFDFADCDTAITEAQNTLTSSLRGSGIVVRTAVLEGLHKSLRRQFVTKSGKLYIKSLVDTASKELEGEIIAATQCAEIGTATQGHAKKILEGIARSDRTIGQWEEGVESPTGERSTDLATLIVNSLKSLEADTESLIECSTGAHSRLKSKGFEQAMLSAALESAEGIDNNEDAVRELERQKVILNGYNSYQRLAGDSHSQNTYEN